MAGILGRCKDISSPRLCFSPEIGGCTRVTSKIMLNLKSSHAFPTIEPLSDEYHLPLALFKTPEWSGVLGPADWKIKPFQTGIHPSVSCSASLENSDAALYEIIYM